MLLTCLLMLNWVTETVWDPMSWTSVWIALSSKCSISGAILLDADFIDLESSLAFSLKDNFYGFIMIHSSLILCYVKTEIIDHRLECNKFIIRYNLHCVPIDNLNQNTTRPGRVWQKWQCKGCLSFGRVKM